MLVNGWPVCERISWNLGQASGDYVTFIEALGEQDYSMKCSIGFHQLLATDRQVGILMPSEVIAYRTSELQPLWNPIKVPRRAKQKKRLEEQTEEFEGDPSIDDGAASGLQPLDDEMFFEGAEMSGESADEAAAAAASDDLSDWEDETNQALQNSLMHRAGGAPLDADDPDLPQDPDPFEEGDVGMQACFVCLEF